MFGIRFSLLSIVLVLVLAACGPSPTPIVAPEMPTPTPASPTAAPALTATSTQVPTATASAGSGQSAVVVFVKDGDILAWDESTGQSQTLFDAGDAIALTMSDDDQVVAFLRRSVVKRSDLDWYEQSALWAMERDGANPRELVSAEALRGLLNASETDSTNIPQLEWIPGTHRLLFNAWKYFVQAEGESHATPEGLYWVDTDTLTEPVQLPENNTLRFSPSPDGQKIALMSVTGLGFINVDGGNYRPDVFTYLSVGLVGAAVPSGVWTQDSSAFLIAASFESDSGMNKNAIWRVPVDGSPAELLASFNESHPDSVTFSPNGRHAAFYRGSGLGGWYLIDLPGEQGPLARPSSAHLFWQNVHWSPAGLAYAVSEKTLFQLCPDAVQDREVCGEGFDLGGDLASIHWLDGNRFLYVTREPYDLYFGRLGGERVRIAEGAERFAAMAMTCRDDSEFTAGGEGPADMSVASENLFRMVWRVRNSGTCTWDASYRLAPLAGERLGGPQGLPLGETVPPGGEIELAVRLLAPATAGTYQGEWRLFAPDGKPFGVRLPVEIVVPTFTVTDFPPNLILAKVQAVGDRFAFGEGAIWAFSFGMNNTVARIDLDTNQVVATIPVGQFLQALAIGHGAVWVAGPGVTRIDPLTNTVSGTIPVGTESELNGVATGAGSVWVSSGSEGVVYRIDPVSNQVNATIQVALWPSQIAATQDAVWVTNPINPVLTRIDPQTNEVAAEIHLDCATRRLAVDATAVWVACENAPTLYRIDPLTNQIIARIAVSNHPSGVAISSKGVWITSLTDNTLTLVDPETNRVVTVYQVGPGPADVVAVQDDLWIVMSSEGALWRIRP